MARNEQGIIRVSLANEMIAQDKAYFQQASDLASVAPLEQQSFRLQYAKAETLYDTLKNNTNSVLSARGKIMLDKRTNTLYVQDTAEHLQVVHDFLSKVDRPVQQVEIEARIVTVDKTFQEELGIRWSAKNQISSVTQGQFSLDLGAGDIGNTKPGSLAFTTLSKDILLDLELSALEAEGDGEILSSPRLLTADQQEALIEQGTEIPYNETTYSGGTATAFKQAVLRLRVTPQISPNGKILLKLQVNQDAKSKDTVGGTAPIIDTRQISTNVLVNNGETVVLGGIYERVQSHNMTMLPFLSSLPLVGELFKHRSSIDTRKELLIFVTPRIMLQEPET